MLKDKVAIVTGASKGIGEAIAKELANNNATVVVVYSHNEDKAKDVVKTITEAGKNADYIKCDVSKFEDCKNLINEVIKKFGKIDIVVNNAGITKDALLLTMKEEDFDIVIDTNLKGAFNVLKNAVPHMIKKRTGRIINISSVSGITGNPGQLNYSASKGGLISMTKTLAKELASRNINCNAIAPGFIETDMSNALPEETLKKVIEQIPLKKRGSVEDIARMVAYLCGEGGNYITGQVIQIDGGLNI